MEHPPTDNELVCSRLSKMSACWPTLAAANDGNEPAATTARLAFVQRYQRAAYRFLLGAVHDADTAEELFQEVVLRFVRGEFPQADPDDMPLRDALRATLVHVVADHDKVQQEQTKVLGSSTPASDDVASSDQHADIAFQNCWRDELLDRAWEKLERTQRDGGPPLYSVLRYYAEDADAHASEVALQLTLDFDIQPALTPEDVRKLLQRARQRFADHLLDEVADSRQEPTDSEIEVELATFDLLRFCRGALSRRR